MWDAARRGHPRVAAAWGWRLLGMEAPGDGGWVLGSPQPCRVPSCSTELSEAWPCHPSLLFARAPSQQLIALGFGQIFGRRRCSAALPAPCPLLPVVPSSWGTASPEHPVPSIFHPSHRAPAQAPSCRGFGHLLPSVRPQIFPGTPPAPQMEGTSLGFAPIPFHLPHGAPVPPAALPSQQLCSCIPGLQNLLEIL